MDRVKIGEFISECRKERQITQEQLAEMLNVTDKSVSKWENGHCLPDAALYEPLCGILSISINELFAGQRIEQADYKRMADNNLMQMIKYRLYSLSDKNVTFSAFDNALTRVAELAAELNSFRTKEEAVRYLMKETQFPFEECEKAFDFYVNLFAAKEHTEDL